MDTLKKVLKRDKPSTVQTQNTVAAEEIEWMLSKRNIRDQSAIYTPSQIEKDYGTVECNNILLAFTEEIPDENIRRILLPLLKWPGIGTRWRNFLSWVKQQKFENAEEEEKQFPEIRTKIFSEYANHLGRITSYRALALDDSAFAKILQKDCIFPTGQLKLPDDATPQEIQKKLFNIVDDHGIAKVLVARLFIAHLQRLIGLDPSVSLHDDFETTSIIASGYFFSAASQQQGQQQKRKVYLFELSVPAILPCEWTLDKVGSFGEQFLGKSYRDHPPWFFFKSPAGGCWFDGTLQRTERYTFYGLPFLKEHSLKNVFCFESVEEISKAVQPFIDKQEQLHKQFPNGEGAVNVKV